MFSIFLQALAIASVGILSPGSMTFVILLLMSGRRGRNGIAFMCGYLVMYTLVGAAVLTLGVNVSRESSGEQSATTSYVLIGLATLFLILTLRNWLKKPEAEVDPNKSSRFAKLVDGITPLKAFGIASLISVINLKNLTIFLTAVSVLLLSDLNLLTQLSMLIPLVLVFCTSVMIPVMIYLLFPEKSDDYLNRVKDAVRRYSRPLGIGLTLIFSLLLFYRGISGLL